MGTVADKLLHTTGSLLFCYLSLRTSRDGAPLLGPASSEPDIFSSISCSHAKLCSNKPLTEAGAYKYYCMVDNTQFLEISSEGLMQA